MTEQEAHDLLHEELPRGSTVTLSRVQWTRSTVGSGPVLHGADGAWHLTVTLPGEADRVEAVFAATLDQAVEKMVVTLRQTIMPAKPPRLRSPSMGTVEEGGERQQVS